MSSPTPAGWFPDPATRYEYRYWDGARWTDHVAAAGRQLVDPLGAAPPVATVVQPPPMVVASPQPVAGRVSRQAKRQVRKLGVGDSSQLGGGTLFTEAILVVNQKAKLIERKAEYAIYSQHGQQLGAVRQFGISMSRMLVGRSNETKRLQIVDAAGQPVMTLTRPTTVLKSTVTVMRENGVRVGQIVQDNFGILGGLLGGRFNVRFRLESQGQVLGSLNAENSEAWDFSILDADETEVARITKTWAGLGKEMFTRADNYVLEMHRKLDDPLLSLVVAAALAVDTVLKQDGNQRSY